MTEETKNGFFYFIYDTIGLLLKVLIIMLVIFTFFIRQVTVSGHSMDDTLNHEDRLLVWNFNYTPQQGDIVIISHGAILQEMLIKRVIATGGQTIGIDYATGTVSIDGVLLQEDYIKGKTIRPLDSIGSSDILIPEGYVFVMGDNREHSTDSRSVQVNLVPVNNIIGKAFFRISPLDSFGILT